MARRYLNFMHHQTNTIKSTYCNQNCAVTSIIFNLTVRMQQCGSFIDALRPRSLKKPVIMTLTLD